MDSDSGHQVVLRVASPVSLLRLKRPSSATTPPVATDFVLAGGGRSPGRQVLIALLTDRVEASRRKKRYEHKDLGGKGSGRPHDPDRNGCRQVPNAGDTRPTAKGGRACAGAERPRRSCRSRTAGPSPGESGGRRDFESPAGPRGRRSAHKGRAAMNLRPLCDRVVVKPVDREEMTKGGIVIPDTATEKPQEGIVEAVGTGRILDTGQRVPMELKVGDKVLYSKYAGSEFKPDDVEYLIVSEKDVLAVVATPSGRTSKTK